MSRFLRRAAGGKKKKRKSSMPSGRLDWMDLDQEYDDFDVEEYEDEEYEEEDEEEVDCEDEDEEYEEKEEAEYEDEDEEYEEEDEEEVEYEDEYEEYEEEDEEEVEYEDEDEEYEEEDEEEAEYEDEDEEYEEEEEVEYEDEDEEYDEEADCEDEDEEYDEEDYDDADDEDEEDDDEYVPAYVKKSLKYRLMHMSAVDHVVVFTTAAVLILAVFTAVLYGKSRSAEKQLEAFAEVGVGMEDMSIIGGSGLLAIADAQDAKVAAAVLEAEMAEEEEEEVRNEEGKIEIAMNLTSIQKDLKIKFINANTGKLIPSVAFEVEIENPSGKTYSVKDEDMDGVIYQTGIEPGRYQLKIIAPTVHDTYSIPTGTEAITVRDTIEYKKVDVSNEVKTEAQVNAAVEDTKVQETVVESVNTDTVEWVESTKTLIEGTEETQTNYEKVGKDSIADPGKSAFTGGLTAAQARMILKNPDDSTPAPTQEPTATPETTQEPTETQTTVPDATEVPTEIPTTVPDATEAPTDAPTKAPDATEVPTATPEKTASPKETPSVLPSSSPDVSPSTSPSASPSTSPSASPSTSPSASPSTSPTATPTATPGGAKNDTTSSLKTTSGEQLYVKDSSGNFREAKYADYYKEGVEFYKKVEKTSGQYRYTGWQNLDGYTYFFDKNGNKVTGEQVIQGAKYTFNTDGSLHTGSGVMGIDVSKWNGNIDWNAVKSSGVSYVIIRCGYRGSTTGALIEDPMFRKNIQGASGVGLKVGIYFFTQAVNEVEAVEEASMVLGLIKGYNISYPVFLDVESSGGRADGISVDTRTTVCKAFCQTIQNSGYKAGVYANKTWFNELINTPSLTGYKIWLAQYAAAPTYTRTKYDMWQYSSKGNVSGIGTKVDMNISYMNY